MTVARRRTGSLGEAIAEAELRQRGYRVLARNCRTRAGELDLVLLDGRTLVFAEVKTMRTGSRSGPERPVLAVGPRKQLQVRRLARAWLAEHDPPPYSEMRFDVVGLLLDPSDRLAAFEHIPNAF